MSRTKNLNKKAKALRLKEQRIRRQAGMLAGGHRILDEASERGYAKGYEQGIQAGLRQAYDLGREHRRMTWFMTELRKLLKEE